MARRLLVMLAACMLAFACGPGSGDPSDQGSPSPPVDPATPGPRPTPRRVEPRPGMVNVEPVAWERVAGGEAGRTLQVIWQSGPEPCFVLDRVEVVQAPQAVTVTLFEGRDPEWPARAPCPAILVEKSTTVVLGTLLGDRKVVDGSSKHGS
jgi:hypothetical protein